VIEETLDFLETTLEQAKKKVHGVVTARVIDVADPLMLGRARVQLPSIDALDLQPWARVALPMAGFLHGHYFLPNVGDEVLIVFEHGDTNVPYIIGSLWTAFAPPPLQSPMPQIRAIRTLAGNQVVFTETPASVTIQTGPTAPAAMPSPPSPVGPHHTVMLSPAGIQAMSPTSVVLQVGQTSIILTPTSITLQCSGNTIALAPGTLSITAAGPLNITAAGPCTISAPLVMIN
jgi:hypothetical protein